MGTEPFLSYYGTPAYFVGTWALGPTFSGCTLLSPSCNHCWSGVGVVPSLAWRPASGETSNNVTETSEALSLSEDDSPTLRERSQSSSSCCAWGFAMVLPFLQAEDDFGGIVSFFRAVCGARAGGK